MSDRRIISRHWLRRTARERLRSLERLQREVVATGVASPQLSEAGIRSFDRLYVDHAGRIRARWAVYAEAV